MAAGCLRSCDTSSADRLIVACDECTFGYQDGWPVLEHINLRLARGDRLVVLGPSGSGKSTLLRLLAGLLQPSSGTITRAVARAGFVFQVSGLLPWLNTQSNVLLPLRLLGVDDREARQRALRALESVGLAQQRNLFPHELSVGMAKRVELARLFAAADLLHLWLLDEPFESVDLPTRISLQQTLLAEAARWDPGVVLVTHSREEALILGTRFAVLHRLPSGSGSTLWYINRDELAGANADQLADLFLRGTGGGGHPR